MISFILIVIAISLFIDAFSLSLVPESSKLKNREIFLLSILIGVFNLIIIWAGFLFGEIILGFVPISPQLIVSLVLFYTGTQMILEYKKNRYFHLNDRFLRLIFISFVFSIDNISLGFSLNYLQNDFYLFSILITILSIVFSYIALKISRLITIL